MAQKNFQVDLNLNLNQLLQARLENVTALPTENLNIQAGRMVYLSTDKHVYKCDGTTWQKLVEVADIPKDMVVQSGSVVKGTFAQDGSFTENASGKDTALKLVIANSSDIVYINVKDLASTYTGGATDDITTAISSTNEITATLSNTVKTQLASIANKVDKEAGKGLSTNDYTTADKTKLANLRETKFFTSEKLEGENGTVTLEGFDSGKSVIMQCTKNGEEIIISLVWVPANKQIEWGANTKFTADDNVVITAIQY